MTPCWIDGLRRAPTPGPGLTATMRPGQCRDGGSECSVRSWFHRFHAFYVLAPSGPGCFHDRREQHTCQASPSRRREGEGGIDRRLRYRQRLRGASTAAEGRSAAQYESGDPGASRGRSSPDSSSTAHAWSVRCERQKDPQEDRHSRWSIWAGGGAYQPTACIFASPLRRPRRHLSCGIRLARGLLVPRGLQPVTTGEGGHHEKAPALAPGGVGAGASRARRVLKPTRRREFK